YLTKRNWYSKTTYLVASQCAPEVFEELKHRNVVLWHCGGSQEDNQALWNTERTVCIGGGTTVGTRAMIIAKCLGYTNLHLFGMDNCVRDDETHAYAMATADESVGPLYPIRIGSVDGREFMMAKYHVAQLRDFKLVLKLFGDRLRITVHGD